MADGCNFVTEEEARPVSRRRPSQVLGRQRGVDHVACVFFVHHTFELTPARLGLLASAMGIGSLVRMGTGLLVRQGVKLVPVAGQTLGAAAAAGTSFATTYALGRAASAWLYGTARGKAPDGATLRALYDQALKGARHASG